MPLRHKNRKLPLSSLHAFWCFCFFNFFTVSAVAGEFDKYATADESDTLYFGVGVNKTYDSNLFRRSTNEVSEQIKTTTLDFKLDKTYSLQRFILDLKYVDYKYDVNDYLDFKAKNYNAAWQWSLTPHLTGLISSQRTESLNSFSDFFVSQQKNIRTFTMNQLLAEYSPHNVWGVIFGTSQQRLENSAQFTAISDFDAVGLDYGVKYQFPSGSNIKLLAHNRRGQYNNRPLDPLIAFDNGYDENEYEVNLNVTEGDRSNLLIKLGYLEREYANFGVRDYDGYKANVSYDLQVSGKIHSFLTYSRVIAPFETTNSTYSISDNVGARVLYDFSSKIQIGAYASYGKRDFNGRGVFDTSNRQDKEYLFDTYIKWNPFKYIAVSLNRTQTNRNSSVSFFDYDDTLTALSLELKI